jgi:probable rRNA maturation factor
LNGPLIEISFESPLWNAIDGETIVRRAVTAAAPPDTSDRELSVVLTDDAAIRALNAQWRKKDEPTNVLSFPAPANASILGDIVIAYETTAREAAQEQKPLADHLSHLAVHGFLHLLGYDHESDADADVMEQLEREILARLGVPDPYMIR